jgi:carboxyl-terminal processing protease
MTNRFGSSRPGTFRLGSFVRSASMLAIAAGLAVSTIMPAGALAQATATQSAPTQPGVATAPVAALSLGQEAWDAARRGDWAGINAALTKLPQGDALAPLRESSTLLAQNIAKREAVRTEETKRVSDELDKVLARERTPLNLSEALRFAVELHMLRPAKERGALIQTPRFCELIGDAVSAARKGEERGEWIMSQELFARLNALLETEGTYKADARRLGERLAMIRLYVPQRLWQLRNERRLLDELPALPAFNATGEDFRAKLKDVDELTVAKALSVTRDHVERAPQREILASGLESVKTLLTTPDLAAAFPGLNDAQARAKLVEFVDQQIAQIKAEPNDARLNVLTVMDRLKQANENTVRVDQAALLHELGNGAFDRLDEFSQIVWPDEVNRFKRITEGKFIGVGIQILPDDESQLIRIVTPIQGSPAQRAGILSGDLIKKINGNSALGMSTDQAIEQITGKAGEKVVLTVERDKQSLDFTIVRAEIPLITVRGWNRGQGDERTWDWFLDPSTKIGYLRLSQFQPDSAADVRSAIVAMKEQGMRGLVFDLRFNPGGLMDQAVKIANFFVERGTLVYTANSSGQRQRVEDADPSGLLVRNVPMVVLINEGSASASEIVSGAIRVYADAGKLDAVVLGERSYGKASVQSVLQLRPADTQVKVTTAYYHLPSGQLIHRRPGALQWGVEPHLKVDMLPRQVSDALLLRQDADLPPEAKPTPRTRLAKGDRPPGYDPNNGAPFPPSPQRLIDDGFDLQLQTAMVLLQARLSAGAAVAEGGPKVERPG